MKGQTCSAPSGFVKHSPSTAFCMNTNVYCVCIIGYNTQPRLRLAKEI